MSHKQPIKFLTNGTRDLFASGAIITGLLLLIVSFVGLQGPYIFIAVIIDVLLVFILLGYGLLLSGKSQSATLRMAMIIASIFIIFFVLILAGLIIFFFTSLNHYQF